jgi:Rod binding domain-containing protein
MNVSFFTSRDHITTADPAALKAGLKNQKTARDFEAMLLTPLLDSLQKTFAGHSEGAGIPGASDYRLMATEALAQAIAARGGIGIAQLILRHFEPPRVSVGAERGL